MKEFTSKTVEEAVNNACKELGVTAEQLVYKVTEEKKGLFSKKATIQVYETGDALVFAQEYLKTAIGGMGVAVETSGTIEEDILRVTITSERNPILIGKNGRTLQALNELTRLAVSNKFHHRYRILLDVGGYKEDKYSRVAYIAKRTANEVLRSHVDVRLDPMTPDERRVVHNTLNGMAHIKTESSGEGLNRAVTVKYIPGPNETKPTSVSKSAPTKPVVEQPAEEKPAETEPAAEEKPVEETEAPKTGE
jgi:spoIIIJ-associated protein